MGLALLFGVCCDRSGSTAPADTSAFTGVGGNQKPDVAGSAAAGCMKGWSGGGDPELLWPPPWPNAGRARWRDPCQAPSRDPLDDYGLDEISRHVARAGSLQCPEVETVLYRGVHFRYDPPAKIYLGFQERLARFEAVTVAVAKEVYGRAPARLRQLGTYNCRRTSQYPNLASEHSLGNAIDVEGFDFGPMPRDEGGPPDLPVVLRRGFAVRVLHHWNAQQGVGKIHARFLRELIDRLRARQDIFRVLLGPGYPGHKNHFHFDCARYRLVEGFAALAPS